MNKATTAMRTEMYFYKNPGLLERKKHERYKQVVQACLLHMSETWSWTKELVDTPDGFESRSLAMMGRRKWKSDNVPSGHSPSDTDQTSTSEIWCSRRRLYRGTSAETHVELRQRRLGRTQSTDKLENCTRCQNPRKRSVKTKESDHCTHH